MEEKEELLQIEFLATSKMQVEELRGYMIHVEDEAQKMKPAVVGDEPPFLSSIMAFQKANMAFADVLKDPASLASARLATEADRQRDNAWAGSYYYIKGMSKHPSEEVAALGVKVLDIYDKYGNPSSLSRHKETGVLADLLEDLETLTTEERTKLGFDIWLNNLEEKHLAYISAVDTRTGDKKERGTGVVLAARRKLEAAYKDMVDMFNALIRIEGEEKYKEFADRMNVLIAEQKTELRRRNTLNKKKNEGETPVV